MREIAGTICLTLALLGCHGGSVPDTGKGHNTPTESVAFEGKSRAVEKISSVAVGLFADMTETSGVRFTYDTGRAAQLFTILESVGGGVGLLDFDNDGDLDLFFPGGGSLSGSPPVTLHGQYVRLFRNDGDWRFQDVTESCGLAELAFYSHGCAVGDYDADGDPDLFVAGYHDGRLLQNQAGRFVDVTAQSGLKFPSWNVNGAWLDYDNDGRMDLFVLTYCDWSTSQIERCLNDRGERDTCGPTRCPGQVDQLFRQTENGSFEDVTEQVGLSAIAARGLGVLVADFNEDGYSDIFVTNDVHPNNLWLGSADGRFEDVGLLWGVALSPAGEEQGSMGVDGGDFDGDGWLDLWYTNFSEEDNSLYRNLTGTGFLDATTTTRLAGPSWRWVGFGTHFIDFDSDGWQDFVIANGHVQFSDSKAPYLQPAQLFRNREGRRFEEVSAKGGSYFASPHAGRGLACGDLDNDGGTDLVVVHQDAPVALLRNTHPASKWIRVVLRGQKSNVEAVGAKVVLKSSGRSLARWVRSGSGYLSSSDPRILFPLETESPATVVVTWPSRRTEVFEKLTPGQTHLLREGDGQPE